MGNISSPTRLGASESAAMPPASESTGRPARSAFQSVGAASGSTPTIFTPPSYHAATPPINPPPPPPPRHQQGIEARRLLFEFQPNRTLAEQCFRLIVSVDGQRS